MQEQPDTLQPAEDPIGDTRSARWCSAALVIVAGIALVANCLLNCPPRFSPAHEADTSLLKPVIRLLAIGGLFPTNRGIEIRDLAFYLGAAVLTLIAAATLLLAAPRARLGEREIFDLRRRIASPYFWWALLLMVSVLSTAFSHSPRDLIGQSIIRFLHAGWWLPLAILMRRDDAKRLSYILVAGLTMTAAVALWYYGQRAEFRGPASYPLGNPLWLGACVLPGVLIGVGLSIDRLARRGRRDIPVAAVLIFGAALTAYLVYCTGARSALVGLAAGIVVFVALAVGRWARLGVVLSAVVIAGLGAQWIQSLRPHSVRARLEYGWPYALELFYDKPITGHGDGAYSLLAGRFARDDQLRDPSVMGFHDETKWVVHAHNEFLELLSDLGLVGCAAFVAALAITFFRAVGAADAGRRDGGRNHWTVVGLAAALAALTIDLCFDNAYRNPGLPAVFLTVWAILWVLVRDHGLLAPHVPDTRRIQARTVRFFGALTTAAALVLGYFAIQNWRGVRAHFKADRHLVEGRHSKAVSAADAASDHILDPFARMAPRITAVRTLAVSSNARLEAGDARPTPDDLDLASNALQRLNAINTGAPQFLWVSRLQVALYQSLVIAFGRLEQPQNARDCHLRLVAAVAASRSHDPFNTATLRDLWRLKRDASVTDRMYWLRGAMRAGATDPVFDEMLADLIQRPTFGAALNDLYQIAAADRSRDPEAWQDPLSPETLRLAGRAKWWLGQNDRAVADADAAADLYARTGSRLFAGHAAAMHESVQYAFDGAPTLNTDRHLTRLADAWALDAPRVGPNDPLPGRLGDTRLRVLLAADREDEAVLQLKELLNVDQTPDEKALAAAYLSTASPFAGDARHAALIERMAGRAAELDPASPDAPALLLVNALSRRADDSALAAARRFLVLSADHAADRVGSYFDSLQRRYPDSSIWQALGRPTPTSQPSVSIKDDGGTTTRRTNDLKGG